MVVGPGLLLPLCGGTGLLSHPGPRPRPLLSGVMAGALGPVSSPERRCPFAPALGILLPDSRTMFSAGQRPRREPQPKTQTSGVGAEHIGVWEEALGSACGLDI